MSDPDDVHRPSISRPDTTSASIGMNLVSVSDVAILHALGRMAAATSTRQQGEVLLAVRRAGLGITAEHALAALENLSRDGFVVGLMTLSDGGVVATLTPLAMAKLRLRREQDVQSHRAFLGEGRPGISAAVAPVLETADLVG